MDSFRNETKSELASLRNEMLARFEAIDVKISSLRNETKSDIESLRKETKSDFDSLRNEIISRFEAVDSRFDSLEARIAVMEKIAELEVRLADCAAF